MEHTQGKWFNNGGRIYAQQGDDIREICDVGLVNHQTPEDTANACLIVAAPVLLAACEEIASWTMYSGKSTYENCEPTEHYSHAYYLMEKEISTARRIAKIAIAKAKKDK